MKLGTVRVDDFVAVLFNVTDTGVKYRGSGASFDKKTGCDSKLGKNISSFSNDIKIEQDVIVFNHDICVIPLRVIVSPKLDIF